MADTIFLSASVPDPRRSPRFAESADSVAITAAVTALMYVTLGRRMLVWGGHPAITPMIWVAAESMDVDYATWVKLYQSKFFEDDFPEENARFGNVVFVDTVDNDRGASLRLMRERMFREQQFQAAVFIGGMDGILDEYELFHRYQPTADVVPVASTGGAALELANRLATPAQDLREDLDYVALFHRHLHIQTRERRFRKLVDQPAALADRLYGRSG